MYKIYRQQYLTPDKKYSSQQKANLLSFIHLIYIYTLDTQQNIN